MTKTAIITGICGQDGAYLARLLLEKGYRVIGWARRNANTSGLKYLGVLDDIELRHVDICDAAHVQSAIAADCSYIPWEPDEIYNLAAQSHVGMSFNNAMFTCQVNYGGYLNVLLGARKVNNNIKIYQAGTSEMFGYAAETIAEERTPFAPMSPYAISKVAAHWAGVNARFEADQFVCNGILFNHESPIRGEDFVTRKITKFIAQYAKNNTGVLQLGNIDSVRDWGHAKDYVQAMHAMMQHSYPDDYVIATGNALSVRKFLVLAFAAIAHELVFEGSGLAERGYVDGKCVVEISPDLYRPNDLKFLKGNAAKARQVLKWQPTIGVQQLVEEMITADIERL